MLVSTEPGGLGNRIKSWVSATRLDPGARVHWPQTPNMPAAFSDLFTNDCSIESVPAGAVEHCSWQLLVHPEDAAELPADFAAVVSSASPMRRRLQRLASNLRGQADDRYRYMISPKRFSMHPASPAGRAIDLEYNRIPQAIRDRYAGLFAQIVVSPQLLGRVDAFAAERLDAAVAGVQVRTWRDSPRRHRRYFRRAAGRLSRLLQAADPALRFFVVSDDDDAIAWLAGIVGASRVLSFPRSTARRMSWQSPAGMQEDLIDMLLLARTRELYASYLSSFSEVAWWLGGASARVTVF
jgi:hypothetical protein